MTVTWADTSHYQRDAAGQSIPIDDSYPHPVFCFRTNSGDRVDEIAEENARRALAMLDSGKLQAVLPYYFFWPGQGNCDLHREILERAGLWLHPRTATMVDVEDAGGQITGDQSAEVNDEVERLRRWYGNPRRVIGYLNAVANAGLWRSRPAGMRFVTPSYSHRPGVWASNPPPQWMRELAIAQQWTDRGRCAPWPYGVDLNQSPLELPDLLALLGIEGGTVSDPITVGAGQLRPPEEPRLRQILHPENVSPSTRSPEEAWPYDMWADFWNEVVWDGFTLPGAKDDPDPETHSLVGWVLAAVEEGRARDETLNRLEAKLDRLLGEGVK
ncbi:hypothetical protein [Nocardia wallacei]|uniref:Uncharacterized protein n=1 Tax=Nocardia wallacei TaxID=480035 RepID=A0A7G1KYY9_9NOCA|nr:hypothetical protein [Nocardia wallacei]BCK58384.1 hypothetical protein NWFMUON74_61560 [Nocardia wallacei]